MNFVMSLLRTKLNHNTIWVVVDQLKKLAHILLIKATDSLDKFVKLYIKEVIRLLKISVLVVSY